ncbi:MAG: DNA/RNA-binding protein AlbA [Promethearchaeota archaeon]
MAGKEENSVFVGRRPTMNYVMATMMILNKNEDCTVKARGRAISHAVDVCEILRNRFLKGTEYKGITLSTEQLEGEKTIGRRKNCWKSPAISHTGKLITFPPLKSF